MNTNSDRSPLSAALSSVRALAPASEPTPPTQASPGSTPPGSAKPASAPAPKPTVKAYPFRSKKQIVALIATDDGFACECLGIMYARQTAYEQEAKTTLNRNHRGFMSSHAVNGTTLAKKFLAGEVLSEEELAKTRAIVSRYGRQLAEHYRLEDIAAKPELADAAAIFFSN
jgi:hypothetical protein